MYRLQPTNTSTPTEKDFNQQHSLNQEDGNSETMRPQKLSYHPGTLSQDVDQNLGRQSNEIDQKSEHAVLDGLQDGKVEALLSKARGLYCPSSSQPYATYVRPNKDRETGDFKLQYFQLLHDKSLTVFKYSECSVGKNW
jgi:hypothetical protein